MRRLKLTSALVVAALNPVPVAVVAAVVLVGAVLVTVALGAALRSA
jgi:hypothetical protein